MNKICTSLDQSRKLIELGIDIKTSDMYYYTVNGDWEWYETPNIMESIDDLNEHTIPAWSLSALMSLLPSIFTVKGEYSETTCYKIDIRQYALTKDVDIYQIAYGNYRFNDDGSFSWSDMINTGQREELIDVAVEMLTWLKENNII